MEWYSAESQPMALDEGSGYPEYYARRVPSHSYDCSSPAPAHPPECRSSVASVRSVHTAPETPKAGISFRPYEDCLVEETSTSPPRSYSSSYVRSYVAYPPTPSMKASGSYIPASSPAHRFAPYRSDHHAHPVEPQEWRRTSSGWAPYENGVNASNNDMRMHSREERRASVQISEPIAIPSHGTANSTQPISIPDRRGSYEYGSYGAVFNDADIQRSYTSSVRTPYGYVQQPPEPAPTPSGFSSSLCPPSFAAHNVPTSQQAYPTYPTPPPSQSPTSAQMVHPPVGGFQQQSVSPSQALAYGASFPVRPMVEGAGMRGYSTSVPNHVSSAESSLLRKREMHNLLERKRRDGLRDCFASLCDVLPDLEKEEGTGLPAKVTVLQVAAERVRELKEDNQRAVADLAALRQSNAVLRARLRELQTN